MNTAKIIQLKPKPRTNSVQLHPAKVINIAFDLRNIPPTGTTYIVGRSSKRILAVFQDGALESVKTG